VHDLSPFLLFFHVKKKTILSPIYLTYTMLNSVQHLPSVRGSKMVLNIFTGGQNLKQSGRSA
jgi:hypothetical protein